MLDQEGVDDGVDWNGINAVVHMVVHVIVRPSCSVLKMEILVLLMSLFQPSRRHRRTVLPQLVDLFLCRC